MLTTCVRIHKIRGLIRAYHSCENLRDQRFDSLIERVTFDEGFQEK